MINKTKTLFKIGIITFIVTTASFAKAENVALLIGISDYQNLEKEDLDGPKNDVEALKEVLINKWQFKPDDIKVLTDSQASHKGILDALNSLENQTKPGDEILIYLSGHGTSIYDNTGGGDSFKDALSSNSGAFVPYDYDTRKIESSLSQGDIVSAVKNNFITGQYHLRPIIEKLEKDRFVTGIIDACFSEHSFRSIKNTGVMPNRTLPFDKVSSRELKVPSQSTVSKFNDDKYPYRNTITIAASSKAQPARDISQEFLNKNPNTTFDNKPHGLFSDLLIRILNGDIDAGGQDGIISYNDLEEALKSNISNYPIDSKDVQTPHIQPLMIDPNSSNIINRPLFGQNRSLVRYRQMNARLKIKIDEPTVFEKIVDNSIYETSNSGLVDFIVTGKKNRWQLSTGNGTSVLTNADDQQLQKRINTAYWLKAHLAISPDITQIRANALPESAGNIFKEGETTQFAVSFDNPSTLLIFNINSQGDINILHPVNSNENKVINVNQLKTFPENDKIDIQAPFGMDQVIFVTLREPLNNIELGAITKLYVGSNSTLSTPDIKVLSNIIRTKATAIRQLKIQTHAK